MVTFKNQGRLGNFLFEAAAALAYSLKHQLPFTVPAVSRDPIWHPVYLPQLVNRNYDPYLPCMMLREAGMPYSELPFSEKWKDQNVVLQGYFQSEKYFAYWRESILAAFDIPWKPFSEPSVAVHVRRGDYLTIKKDGVFKHPPVTKAWMEEQMQWFEGYRFKFFSDDIDWCEKEFGKRKDCDFSHGHTEMEDLSLMSSCNHQICSASTFSWWGAWLNKNEKKRVIMPKQWFSPGWGGHDTRDIVPDRWERY